MIEIRCLRTRQPMEIHEDAVDRIIRFSRGQIGCLVVLHGERYIPSYDGPVAIKNMMRVARAKTISMRRCQRAERRTA